MVSCDRLLHPDHSKTLTMQNVDTRDTTRYRAALACSQFGHSDANADLHAQSKPTRGHGEIAETSVLNQSSQRTNLYWNGSSRMVYTPQSAVSGTGRFDSAATPHRRLRRADCRDRRPDAIGEKHMKEEMKRWQYDNAWYKRRIEDIVISGNER